MGDPPDDEDELAFVRRSLAELGDNMPRLIEQLRRAAQLRGEAPPPLPTSDESRTRLDAVVAYLDRYGQPDDSPPAPHALEAILRTVVALARPELTRRAAIVERYAAAPPVLAAARALERLFLHFVVNAAQAIGEGHAADNRIEVRLATDARGWAVVEIEDTGSGIPDEVLPRIFDPHFSTKRGAGKGLGLTLAKQVVSELGGELRVATAVGEGTTFTVALPPSGRQP